MFIVRRVLLLFSFIVLLHFQTFPQENPSTGKVQLDAVAKIFEAISQNNFYAENLASASYNILPIGVRRVQNNMEVIVAVDKATFHPDYTEVNVMAKVVLPQKDERGRGTTLFFGARGIKFSNDGSIIGDANLALLEDITIPFNNGNMSLVLRADYDTSTGNSRSKTYLSVDCAGFKELGLDADICFPTTLLEKVDPNGNPDGVVTTIAPTILLPDYILRRNPGISPIAQQKLFDYFSENVERIEELIPVYPNDEKANDEYTKFVGRIGKTISDYSPQQNFSKAILLTNWMKGMPLSYLISSRYKYYQSKPEKYKNKGSRLVKLL